MLGPQFLPWCDSASPTSPLPWRELQPRLPLPWREGLEPAPYLIRGEGETHTPGIVKLWESPGRAGGLPRINYLNAQVNAMPADDAIFPASFWKSV